MNLIHLQITPRVLNSTTLIDVGKAFTGKKHHVRTKSHLNSYYLLCSSLRMHHLWLVMLFC